MLVPTAVNCVNSFHTTYIRFQLFRNTIQTSKRKTPRPQSQPVQHATISQSTHTKTPRSQLRRRLPILLSRKRRNRIHQPRTQNIIANQPFLLKLPPHIAHALRLHKPSLDHTRRERRELRLLPAPVLAQLDVHEIQAFERVVDLDAAEQVHAALLARVALDGGVLVDDGQLVAVGDDGDLVARQYADEREDGAAGLPALGAAAEVVVEDVGAELDADFVGGAVAG